MNISDMKCYYPEYNVLRKGQNFRGERRKIIPNIGVYVGKASASLGFWKESRMH